MIPNSAEVYADRVALGATTETKITTKKECQREPALGVGAPASMGYAGRTPGQTTHVAPIAEKKTRLSVSADAQKAAQDQDPNNGEKKKHHRAKARATPTTQ